MRTIWNILSFLAVVNLLALGLFVGWLAQSDRLSMARVEAIRDLLSPTVTASEEDAKETQDAVQTDTDARLEAAREADPSLPTADEMRQVRLVRQAEAESERRVRDFVSQRRSELESGHAALERDRAALDAERAAWEDSIAAQKDRRTDAQFQKTVKLYDTSPAKIVKQWISTLVADGEMDQAVAYLDAMKPMAAKNTLAQFKTEDETRLATELLERLRTFGTAQADTEGSEEPSNADASASADASGSNAG